MKAIIVNADDFGLDAAVNKGIMEAFSSGILSSATIMANCPGFEEAAAFAKRNRRCSFGIHLNLTTGKPLTQWTQEMKKSFLKKAILGMANKESVYNELHAQISKALDAKINLSHLDGHHHVHVFPKIVDVVLQLADEFKIRKMRLPAEPVHARYLQAITAKVLSQRAKKKYLSHRIQSPNYFRGIGCTGNLTVENFKNILRTLKPGVTEIMCHPGYSTDKSVTRLNKERELELKTLQSEELQAFIKEQGIKIINYRDLP